jgi:chromosome transmission fidelity protein 18
MALMPSSPPASPCFPRKRKRTELDLGTSTLTRAVKAQKTYYGIDVNKLLEEAKAEAVIEAAAAASIPLPSPPAEPVSNHSKPSLLWTEKYRARKFTDLIGDERTHRSVMHWLKCWDQIVFPGSARSRPKFRLNSNDDANEEKPHRKILMLTGPPGFGKTTLAHVCAKQAGYEVQEINASDERSSSVVKGRIRDMVGTENVKGVDVKTANGKTRKAGKPVCVIVDEVDGVVSGSAGAGGEGGFIKALIDLLLLDQKNSTVLGTLQQAPTRKKKGDRFRLLRPLILVCNDVYHPSLRPLRQSSLAEVIHVRKPAVTSLISRLQTIFVKENVPCETDGVRRLCEATWGVSNKKEDRHGNGAGEGDMRGIMVVGEWVARKLRATNDSSVCLTRKWVEDNVLRDLAHGGGAARGLGRGGPKDIADRVFQEGAGFPKTVNLSTPDHQTGNKGVKGVAEGLRRTATQRLRELIDTLGDTDRIAMDCFTSYPDRPFQDDTYLSKPDAAYEWLNFHDRLSSAVFSSNEWELAPYLSSPILAFHHLFASPTRAQFQAAAAGPTYEVETEGEAPHPFTGPNASWAAHEAQKVNAEHLKSLQTSLSLPLTRMFSSPADIAVDLQPYLLRMLSPDVNPVIIAGSGKEKGASIASVRKASEQTLLKRSLNAMGASGVRFDRLRVSQENGSGGPAWGSQQFIYRMEPPVDLLCTFETGGKALAAAVGDTANKTTRYAVRQVLEQEWRKEELRLAEETRAARMGGSAPATTKRSGIGADREGDDPDALEPAKKRIARDFFGRPIVQAAPPSAGSESDETKQKSRQQEKSRQGSAVRIAYNEGYSNAVRKPLTMAEFFRDL